MKGVLPESVSVSFLVSPPKNTQKQRNHVTTWLSEIRIQGKGWQRFSSTSHDPCFLVLSDLFLLGRKLRKTELVKLGTGFCWGFVWIHIMWGYNFINTCFFWGFQKKGGFGNISLPQTKAIYTRYIQVILQEKSCHSLGQRPEHVAPIIIIFSKSLCSESWLDLRSESWWYYWWKKSGVHQLRLVDLPHYIQGFYTSNLVIAAFLNHQPRGFELPKVGLLILFVGALAPNKDHVLIAHEARAAIQSWSQGLEYDLMYPPVN